MAGDLWSGLASGFSEGYSQGQDRALKKQALEQEKRKAEIDFLERQVTAKRLQDELALKQRAQQDEDLSTAAQMVSGQASLEDFIQNLAAASETNPKARAMYNLLGETGGAVYDEDMINTMEQITGITNTPARNRLKMQQDKFAAKQEKDRQAESANRLKHFIDYPPKSIAEIPDSIKNSIGQEDLDRLYLNTPIQGLMEAAASGIAATHGPEANREQGIQSSWDAINNILTTLPGLNPEVRKQVATQIADNRRAEGQRILQEEKEKDRAAAKLRTELAQAGADRRNRRTIKAAGERARNKPSPTKGERAAIVDTRNSRLMIEQSGGMAKVEKDISTYLTNKERAKLNGQPFTPSPKMETLIKIHKTASKVLPEDVAGNKKTSTTKPRNITVDY